VAAEMSDAAQAAEAVPVGPPMARTWNILEVPSRAAPFKYINAYNCQSHIMILIYINFSLSRHYFGETEIGNVYF
jgi:hypothetical protein